MFRRLISILTFAAVTVCAGAEGYKVEFKTVNTTVFATITQDADSDKSLKDAVSEVNSYSTNDLSVYETTIVGTISDNDMEALNQLAQIKANFSEAKCNMSLLDKSNIKYIVLPNGMSKAEVNDLGKKYYAAASATPVTVVETKWVYDDDVIYDGQPVESNGVYTGTVKTTVELTKTSESYLMNGSAYEGTVFVHNGTCYGISDESQMVELTVKQGYTYSNYGTVTEYTGKVAEVDGKFYGVINPTEEHELAFNQSVTYTYTYGNNTCAWMGNVYNNGATIFYQGGTEYKLNTIDTYTYTNNYVKYIYEGFTRTDGSNTYGWIGGTKVPLTSKDVWKNGNEIYDGPIREENGKTYGGFFWDGPYPLTKTSAWTYDQFGTIFLYNNAIRTENGVTYGNTGTPYSLEITSEIPYTYYNNGTYIYDSQYITSTNKGNVGGTLYTLESIEASEEEPIYIFNNTSTWPHVNELYFSSEKTDGTYYTEITSGICYYYTKDNKKIYIIEGDIYRNTDESDTNMYAFDGGTTYDLTRANENLYYYIENNNKVVYTDKIYHSQEDEEIKFGFKDSYSEVVLTYGNVYLKQDGTIYTGTVFHDQNTETSYFGGGYNTTGELVYSTVWCYKSDTGNDVQYTGGVYTENEETFGFIGGTEYSLTYETVKYYENENTEKVIVTNSQQISIDGNYYYIGGTATALNVNNPALICNTYTDSNGRTVIYEGKIYGDNTAYIGGTDVELTYGDIYMNGESIYTGYRTADNKYGYTGDFTQLTTNFTYTYTDPIDGTTKEYSSTSYLETLEMDRTVTLTSKEIDVPTGKLHLTAYVSVPGSLRKTLEYWGALGNNTVYSYAVANITKLTISGSLLGSDIANGNDCIKEDGHAFIYNGNVQAEGQTSATGSIAAISGAPLTYIDLEDAVFETQTDMNLRLLGSNTSINTVILPVSEKMTLIPDNCMNNFTQLTELCIPHNFEEIGSAAFYNTGISHIYTTDPNEDIIVDHGDSTLTFSANLKWIHSPKDKGGTTYTFSGGGMNKVKEVYVLAEVAPKCDAYSFQGSMTCGNNGFAGNLSHPIGRHNYINSNQLITVLHYPTSCTTEEAQNYTDITRKYTLVDEVGGIDGRGKSLTWPRHAEFWRSYQQAINGYIWGAWREYPDNGVTTEVISELATATQYGINESLTYNQEDYQGWHEFVLVGNNNTRDFDPQEENTQFVQRDWYTLCVPYDLTKSQLLNTLGIKANAGGTNYVTMLNGTEEVQVTEDLYPDVRTLTHVSRSMNNRMVTLHLSKPLLNNKDEDGNNYDVEITEETGQGFEYNTLEGDDPVVMRGGHPYLVKCYVPTEWNEKIKNLGMYIMAVAESANHTATEAEEEAPYKFGDCTVQATGGSIMLPCIKHKIHALNADSEEEAATEYRYTYEDTNKETPALYHFIGTYSQTTVPQYGYYLGKSKSTGEHKFFRTTKTTTSWNPYSAVIVGLSDPIYEGLEGTLQSGGTGNLSDISINANNDNDLIILAGETNDPSLAGKALTLDFDKGTDESTTDGIVDVETERPIVKDNKVYNLNGAYVGDNLYDLPKGIYIVNGMKHVVK